MTNTGLEIKVSRIHKINDNELIKAFVDIAIADAILIKGLKIVSNKRSGLFVSLPAEKAKDNKWYDTVRCLTQEIKDQITDVCLAAYYAE